MCVASFFCPCRQSFVNTSSCYASHHDVDIQRTDRSVLDAGPGHRRLPRRPPWIDANDDTNALYSVSGVTDARSDDTSSNTRSGARRHVFKGMDDRLLGVISMLRRLVVRAALLGFPMFHSRRQRPVRHERRILPED